MYGPSSRPAHPYEKGSQVEPQLGSEPLANEAVYVEVKAGVENNEDIVKVGDTKPECWDGILASTGTLVHSEIINK